MPKPLYFDSAFIDADAAEEIWRESLRPMYEIHRLAGAAFRATIRTWDMGGAMLMTLHGAGDEVQFRRTRRRIATSGVDHYLLHCLLGGSLTSESAEGAQRVPVNSVVIRDMAVENVGIARDAPMITLSIPRAALDRRMPVGARLHGACWDASDPIGGMVASHICSLARLATDMSDEQAALAAGATLDLLGACLVPKTRFDTKKDDPRLAPMLRARALSHIEQNLLDPDLDAESLRRALGISRTALYELFDETGGVARHIRDRRLDEAMRRLVSPRHGRERIAEIAYAMGFGSEKTFNRAFKERFDCAPGEAREEGSFRPAKTAYVDDCSNVGAIAAQYHAKVRGIRG
ncbi:helix-turn-helix domain-containing protein [Caballeronia ptereochthonis]|uniref:AraC family transcriptional regulator n=1 Tax=Caballeronia ptereochthonis TaxID=1777144 RepID=A0A158E9H2_9BURK|nr:helix-turn-helix domain-containing protein [Caballeronia ptereochthonis]SAL03525.1 AraC family transcriptional regulator [Caballeronia ptereochthonis]